MNNIFRANFQARQNQLIKSTDNIKLEDSIKTKENWNIM